MIPILCSVYRQESKIFKAVDFTLYSRLLLYVAHVARIARIARVTHPISLNM